MDKNLLIALCIAGGIVACILLAILIWLVVVTCRVKRRGKNNPAEQVKTRAKVYRVSYNRKDHTWVIKRDRAGRIIDSFFTKAEAIARVNELSENQDVGFTVKKKNGRFQKKDNY